MNIPIKALVLAAGQGKRMRTDGSDIPKVMRIAGGKPLLHYVLGELDFIPAADIFIIAGYMREQIIGAFPGYSFAVQNIQLGTGHAVSCGLEELGEYSGNILVCCGDMPLLKRETYKALINLHEASGADCTILSGLSDKPLPYGRIIRDSSEGFQKIAEERDCTPEQLKITELNAGVYVFGAAALRGAITGLSRDNAQGEYYLTDAPELILKSGGRVQIHKRTLNEELTGVNTPDQLSEVEAALNIRNNSRNR